MGTSQRYNPSVKGAPNWGKASADVSRLDSVLTKEEQLEKNASNMQIQTYNKQKSKLSQSRNRIYKRIVANTLKARTSAQNNHAPTRAMGHGGIAIIQNFVKAIAEIKEQGLTEWLSSHNLGTLEGKNKADILDVIELYVQDNLVVLDSTAANEALAYLKELLDERIDDIPENFNLSIEHILLNGELKEIIDKFFSKYIYCHISQSIFEKLEKTKGTEHAQRTLNEIEQMIMEDVLALPADKDVANMDWKSEVAKQWISKEYESITKYYLEDEN